MTILETLQTDHRQVKVLLETILSTNDAKKRGDLLNRHSPDSEGIEAVIGPLSFLGNDNHAPRAQ
jgi:hypothetical protein